MTPDDQRALRLAARLMEAGAAPSQPLPDPSDDGMWQGLFLAERLSRTLDAEEAAVAAARLRRAAA